LRAASFDSATSLEKGHGRIERRTVVTSTWLENYLDWPDVRQVFRLRRERTIKGKKTVEEAFGITSLPPERASAKHLLKLVRSHWGIENQLFGVRDVTLGEDANRARKGNAAEALAIIRNIALAILPRSKKRSRASRMRLLCFQPQKALDLVIKPKRE
jgi:predicted transposase YbfD/YdcC